MRILLSGSSGFIGSSLCSFFLKQGHEVIPLTRSRADSHSIVWSPQEAFLPKKGLERLDVVIHLAGEPIAARWTPAKRREIFSSRVQSTSLLSETLASLDHPPKVFIVPSAVGYYGDRGEEQLTETSAAGHGFLPTVCTAWERASLVAEGRGIRVVRPRFGAVLGEGGLLQPLVAMYKLGLGGKLGSGEQWMSWIAIDDLISAIDWTLQRSEYRGAVNFVSPEPIRQKEFATLLARLLHRPTFFSPPRWLLKLFLGQMAEELLLSSTYVKADRLEEGGFQFRFRNIEPAFKHYV